MERETKRQSKSKKQQSSFKNQQKIPNSVWSQTCGIFTTKLSWRQIARFPKQQFLSWLAFSGIGRGSFACADHQRRRFPCASARGKGLKLRLGSWHQDIRDRFEVSKEKRTIEHDLWLRKWFWCFGISSSIVIVTLLEYFASQDFASKNLSHVFHCTSSLFETDSSEFFFQLQRRGEKNWPGIPWEGAKSFLPTWWWSPW